MPFAQSPSRPREIALRAFAAGERGDIDAFTELVHLDAKLVPFTALGEHRGPEGARRWLESSMHRFESWSSEIDSVDEIGDAVVLGGRMIATPRGRPALAPVEMAWLLRIRDDLLVHFEAFTSIEAARRAAQTPATLG